MSIPKVIGWIVIIWVLYAVIAHPANSAQMTHNAMTDLRNAGDNMVMFVNGIVGE
jgi:hypothetical protein